MIRSLIVAIPLFVLLIFANCKKTGPAVPEPTNTPQVAGTSTITATFILSSTETTTPSASETVTSTSSSTETGTVTQTATGTNTATPVYSPTDTATPSASSTISATPSESATFTETPSASETHTVSPTATNTPFMIRFGQGTLPDASYGLAADTYLSSAYPNDNYGGRAFADTGYSTLGMVPRFRTLMKFGIACATPCIPAGATIAGATITLYSDTRLAEPELRFFECTEDWVEGVKSGSYSITEATWDNRGTGSWTTAGGSPGSAASDRKTIDYFGYHVFTINPSVVQAWLDSPSANYGLVLTQDPELTTLNTYSRFHTKEDASTAYRPLLTVYYYAP